MDNRNTATTHCDYEIWANTERGWVRFAEIGGGPNAEKTAIAAARALYATERFEDTANGVRGIKLYQLPGRAKNLTKLSKHARYLKFWS